MIYDLGQTAAFQFLTFAADGVTPANAATVIATVTLPDQTTASATVGAPSPTGTYVATYVPTQSGRHLITWVTTGPAQTYRDVFNVGAADEGWIVGLNDAKQFLRDNGLTGAVADNQRLRDFIGMASATLTYFVGDVASTPYDEWYDGGASRIALMHLPVTSITAVTETFGGSTAVHVLTAEVLDGAGPFDSFGYTIDLRSGVLTRRMNGIAAPFWTGTRNIHVQYVAGNQAGAADLVGACLELVRYYWTQSQGAGGAYGSAVPITDFASLPNIVQNKLGRWRLFPGIA